MAVAVSATFVVALVCSLGRAWGNTGATVGGSVLNMFVISLAYPATTLSDALGRAGYAIVGGAWSGLLALVLWPIRPYRPARLALAECLRTLADYVMQVVGPLESSSGSDQSLPAGSLIVRAALDGAPTPARPALPETEEPSEPRALLAPLRSHLATVRVTNTLLGGLLALSGARLLWPAPEWKRLPVYLVAALRANRDYLRTTVRVFPDRSEAAGRELRERRRDAALAAINAEESFQRLMGEHARNHVMLAPVMTFLAYALRPPLDPIVRSRLTRLGRQLDTLVSAAEDVAAKGSDGGTS